MARSDLDELLEGCDAELSEVAQRLRGCCGRDRNSALHAADDLLEFRLMIMEAATES